MFMWRIASGSRIQADSVGVAYIGLTCKETVHLAFAVHVQFVPELCRSQAVGGLV